MITSTEAEAIWLILVQECGARDDQHDRWAFCHYLAQPLDWHEWRFQGVLGFGGKFYARGGWRVGCYHDDRTPSRDAMIARANARLRALRGQK